MISENNSFKYENMDKIYIPIDYYKNSYVYTISGDEITIYTNNNCRTQNLTKYCDCYRYNERYNIITEKYECRVDNIGNYKIDHTNISVDINDSIKITNEYIKEYTILFGIIITALLFCNLMKRNGRKI